MRTRGAILGCVLIAAGVLPRAQTPARPPAQTFRTGTDVVFVDVSVRDGGRPVTGLGAADFELTDNGVRQTIDSVESAAVPIDLTVVVDVSGNARAPWATRTSAARTAQRIQGDLAAIAKLLRPEDRLRLLASDTRLQQLLPMQAATAPLAIGRLEAGGMSALYDTIASALLYPGEPARRHIVIVSTKGIDTISSVEAATLRTLAQRSDTLLHIVAQEAELGNESALNGFQCTMAGYCWPTRRFWIPFHRQLFFPAGASRLTSDGQALAAGADATGGAVHVSALLTEPSLTGTFRTAFDEFRSGYVLRYNPAGVARAGWHTIQVRVPRSRAYAVRARNGYAIDDVRPAGPPPPVPENPRTLGELTEAYTRRAFRQVTGALRAAKDPRELLAQFEERGNPWPAAPKIEAAFAVELAEPAVFSSDARTRDAAYEMLNRFARFIRHPLEPDAFERYWYFAALTLLEGTLRPAATEALANQALARFPDEPRFILSRAIAADQRSATHTRAAADRSRPPQKELEDAIRARYEAAIGHPTAGAEARIRFAWFLHRTGEHDQARVYLTEAGADPIQEAGLRFLRLLFLGHVLEGLNRPDEALAAFRGAVEVLPDAQSARVALMNALLMRGERAEAEALAEQIQSARADDVDPWWIYWQGQYRLHGTAMARLREMSR